MSNKAYLIIVLINLKENLIILLPYIDYECRNILQIVRDIDYQNGEIIIKFHPTMRIKDYNNYIQVNPISTSTKRDSDLLNNNYCVKKTIQVFRDYYVI